MSDKDIAAAAAGRPEDEMLPPAKLLGFGTQHILSMFGGVIAVPFIVGGAAHLSPAQIGVLVSSALFVSGLATILQTLGIPYIGAKLPLVQGISFASVSTMVTIVANHGAGTQGLRVVFGAVVAAAAFGFLIAPVFSKLVRYFPPVVTGSVITVIGISLMPAATGWVSAQKDSAAVSSVAMAGIGLALVLVFSKTPKVSRLAILLALIVGTAIAAIMGQTTWKGAGAAIVGVPHPFAFGLPVFDVAAIVSMIIVILVIMVETTADLLAVGEVVGTTVDNKRVAAGLRADMLSSALAPVFNSFPASAFAQNVGLVSISGIKSRYVVATGGAILAVLGLSPLLAAVVNLLPLTVLGGVGLVLFGSVTASGIRALGRVDYRSGSNIIIVATSVGFGLIPLARPHFWAHFPAWWQTIFDSEISATAIVAFLLNLAFNEFRPGSPEVPHLLGAAPAVMVGEDQAKVLGSGGMFKAGETVMIVRPDSIAQH
ncbi:uracil permease [Mycobacterium sp. ST-F2]|uniref:nucleobase:cation symporter-2 family protein n=1 Tax=Mycobacterium sp. ST-F2 TaxID=1490484 RepID=UPI00093E412F|nr:nucleobase:cation symporter-2 family protein [Mycobacterium sp. ST-F2]OKH79945.1 uracil permease [Mycobacterium sp. ST-F2]